MILERMPWDLSVCRGAALPPVDLLQGPFFVARTDVEVSLVCLTSSVPSGMPLREDGWKAFRVRGVLDFSQIGILAGIARILAENGIGILALSTYDTDYILVKAEALDHALTALSEAGYEVVLSGV